MPGPLIGPSGDNPGQDLDDGSELAVVDPYEDGAAGMVPTLGCPPLHDSREVGDVEGDEDATLVSSDGQKLFVAGAVELPLLVRGPDVVASVPKGARHATARNVSIEKEAHGLSAGGGRYEVDEREVGA